MTQPTSRDPDQMAEIMASIRRIVQEQDQRLSASPLAPVEGDVLVLTHEMRIDAGSAPASTATAPAPVSVAPLAGEAGMSLDHAQIDPDIEPEIHGLSADESAMIEISRAVLRDELEGDGETRALLKRLIREELAAARAAE